jgi:cation diffusion facilitator CzcD-associated flavoprotein CzcO
VVIGSGATAIALIPALAERAGKVTMLQRSPTYIVSASKFGKVAAVSRKVLPQTRPRGHPDVQRVDGGGAVVLRPQDTGIHQMDAAA